MIKKHINNLRDLPESKKKIILFSVVGISGIFMLFFTVFQTIEGIQKIEQSAQKLEFPNIDVPQMQGAPFTIETDGMHGNLVNVSEGDEAIFEFQNPN